MIELILTNNDKIMIDNNVRRTTYNLDLFMNTNVEIHNGWVSNKVF
jgi:hypothetical protein